MNEQGPRNTIKIHAKSSAPLYYTYTNIRHRVFKFTIYWAIYIYCNILLNACIPIEQELEITKYVISLCKYLGINISAAIMANKLTFYFE